MNLVKYSVCPVCTSVKIRQGLVVKDHSISQQSFVVWQCDDCTVAFTQNVPDATSIIEFYKSPDYISHSDTKKGIVNSLYHLIRKRTLHVKKTLIEKQTGLKKGNLLDIGAGTGAFASHMQHSAWNVTAIEPDDTSREKSQLIYELKSNPVELLWELNHNTYDVVTMWHVLEHVHDLHGYVRQVYNVLKPNGKAFIAVPNYVSFDAAYYKEFWAAYDVPRHLYHFSPKSMKKLLELNALRLVTFEPMWYDSFYVSMLSEKYKHGSYHYLHALYIGLRSNLKGFSEKESCSSLIYIVEKSS